METETEQFDLVVIGAGSAARDASNTRDSRSARDGNERNSRTGLEKRVTLSIVLGACALLPVSIMWIGLVVESETAGLSGLIALGSFVPVVMSVLGFVLAWSADPRRTSRRRAGFVMAVNALAGSLALGHALWIWSTFELVY